MGGRRLGHASGCWQHLVTVLRDWWASGWSLLLLPQENSASSMGVVKPPWLDQT